VNASGDPHHIKGYFHFALGVGTQANADLVLRTLLPNPG
jgi:hypothetical protein